MFATGTVLDGKYRVERVLGQGGMGVVVAATHLHLHQTVALKFLLPHIAENPSVRERFLREARASARLHGEHVCRVSDVGVFAGGSPYIVMEMLEGRDLQSVVRSDGPLQPELACSYVLQACLGIAEAHALGIVHRDLKPANLFLARGPEGSPVIKVLDFGIAKAQDDSAGFHLTQTSAVLGSPSYMSPEQLRSSRDVDTRSDIWSIGVALYELIAGVQPWTGGSITELAFRIAMDPHPPLRGLPAGLGVVIDRCLAKDRAQRYQEVASLAEALALFAGPTGKELASRCARFAAVRASGPLVGGAALLAPTEMPMASPLAGVPVRTPAAGVAVVASKGPSATTLTSASSAVMTVPAVPQPAPRRWGILIAVTVIAVAAGISGAVAFTGSGGSGGDNRAAAAAAAPPQPVAAPAPPPPVAVVPPPVAVVPPPVAVVPPPQPQPAAVDAGVEPADAPVDAPPPPPSKRSHHPPTQPVERDLGAARK